MAPRALCCSARDLSPDAPNARNPVLMNRIHQRCLRESAGETRPFLSLTPTDVLELHEMIPTPRLCDEDDQHSPHGSNKSNDASIVQLLKQKLSRTSVVFQNAKTRSPTKQRTPTRRTKSEKTIAKHRYRIKQKGSDPRSSTYDPDAQLLESGDILGTIAQNADETVREELRRASEAEENAQHGLISLHEIHYLPPTLTGPFSPILSPFDDPVDNQSSTSPEKSSNGRPSTSTALTYASSKFSSDPFIRATAQSGLNAEGTEVWLHGKLPFEDRQDIWSRSATSAPQQDHLLTSDAAKRLLDVSSDYGLEDNHFCLDSRLVDDGGNTQNVAPRQKLFGSSVEQEHQNPYLQLVSGTDCSSVPDAAKKEAVPLHMMRISRHLRSPSSMSNGSSAPETASQHRFIPRQANGKPVQHLKERSLSFESAHVPGSWGTVVSGTHIVPSKHVAATASVCRSDTLIDSYYGQENCDRTVSLDSSENAHNDHVSRATNSSGQPQRNRAVRSILPLENEDGLTSLATMSAIESRLLTSKSSNTADIPVTTHTETLPSAKEAPQLKRISRTAPLAGKTDGPFDQYQDTEPEQSSFPGPSTPSSAKSIGTNLDEASAMWGKALTTHQEETLRPRIRGSSFASSSPRASKRDSKSSEASSIPLQLPGQLGRQGSLMPTPFNLRRVDTSHTFDLLEIPKTSSVSQPGSPNLPYEDSRHASRRISRLLMPDGRQRSISQPPDLGIAPKQPVRSSSYLLVPGRDESGLHIPEITLTDAAHTPTSKSLSSSISGLLPSQRPWARFPHFSRAERNGPAGIRDNVLVRDFQPVNTDSCGSTASLDTGEKMKRKEKARFRARTVMLKRKILLDLSSALKPGTSTFRRRQHGHRSSISAGGVLEYPELELLPLSEPQLPFAQDLTHPPAWRLRDTQMTLANSGPEDAGTYPRRSVSGIGSSAYGPEDGHIQTQSDLGSLGRTASQRADSYRQHLEPDSTERHSGSFFRFDGSAMSRAGSQSPAARSLPPASLVQRTRTGVSRASSNRELRISTQDLNRRLDDDWRASIVEMQERGNEDGW